MKYRALITMFFVLLTIDAFAGIRTKEEMKEAAINVLMNSSAARGMTKSTLSSDLKEYLTKDKLSIIGSEDLGFAVVTNDDRFDEVIGYSTTSFTDEMPCGFKWWLDEVEFIMENSSCKSSSSRTNELTSTNGVSPMMTTQWGQDNPFNAQLRYKINNTTYQFLTGCVATSMAQVMKYHQYPERGQGSIEYIVSNCNARMSHTFEDIYDWDNMLDQYNYEVWGSIDKQAKAVSILMRDCGMAVEMNYGVKASGAQSSKIAPGLIKYFSYDSEGTKYLQRSDYQKSAWMQMIYNELNEGRPIIYSGTDKSNANNPAGHSFVIHGYDTSGKVYVNWGWKGRYDGYFDIDILNPDEHTYNSDQAMVFVNPGKKPVVNENCIIKITSTTGGIVYFGEVGTVTDGTKSFDVKRGTSITLRFSPETGYILKSVKVNNADVTASIKNKEYTIDNIINTTNVDVEFDKDVSTLGREYNVYITCVGNSSSTTTVGSNVRRTIGFSITNSGNKEINISKLIAKNPDTNAILLTSTDTSILGKLSGNSKKTLSITTSSTAMPVFELEYTVDGKECYYAADQYRILTITSNDYGLISFADVQIGTDTKTFSISSGGSATIKFIPEEGCALSKLLVNSSDVTSTVSNNQYTISNITANTTVNATFDDVSGDKPSVDGHEYVDLGLKSGKCWSTMNYGANKPEQSGTYTSSTSVSSWGTHWRVPTQEEFQELIDQCEWIWTTKNGMNGYSVKGPNGKTMFLPAAGYKDHISSIIGNGYVDKGTVVYSRTSSKTTDFISSDVLFRATQTQIGFTSLITSIDDYPIRPISTIIKEPEVVDNLAGDVNNDGSVSVTDVGCVINYILETPPSTFIFAAADMNKDNEISVTDVGYIINYILNEGAASRMTGYAQEQHNSQPTLMAVANGYELAMNGMESFICFQFDIQLTDGSSLDDIQLQNASDHVLTFRQLGDGKYRVVCYSPTNSCFNADGNSLVNIITRGDVNMSNIRFTSSSLDEVCLVNLNSSTTGLSAMGQGMKFYVKDNTLYVTSDCNTSLKLYNINGSLYRTLEIRKGVNTFEGLKAGIYLINNLKIIVK